MPDHLFSYHTAAALDQASANKQWNQYKQQFEQEQASKYENAVAKQNEAFSEVNKASLDFFNSPSRSLSDFDTFISSQKENLGLLTDEQISDLRDLFQNNYGDQFNKDIMDELALDENKGITEDEDAVKAVREGKYLPNRVSENILDQYATPNYHIRLFMMERNWVSEMRKKREPDEQSNIGYSVELPPEKEKIVVIAETGATDITIDDLNIVHKLGQTSTSTSTAIGTSVDFVLIEPGSVSLLDRLAAAKAFLGYTNTTAFQNSAGQNQQDAVITGGGQVPFYLEVTFKGYPDSPDGDEPEGVADPEQIGKKFIYECGYLKFDMDIRPEGATYNCTSHIMNDVARFREYFQIKQEVVIEGTTIRELLHSLQLKLDEQINDQANADNPARTEFTIAYHNIFRPEPAGQNEDGEDIDADGNVITYKDEMNYIGDKLFVDPDRVTPVVRSNTPTWYQSRFKDHSLTAPGQTYYNTYGNIDLPGEGDSNSPISAVAVGGIQGDDASPFDPARDSAEYTNKYKTVLEEPNRVRIHIPSGRTVEDAIHSIMSLCYDLMSKATRLKDFEDPSQGVDPDQTFVYWYEISSAINTDLSDDAYDKLNNRYKSYVEHSVILVKHARTDIGISPEEFNMELTPENIAKRITDLKVQKEYLYMFTGLNDQIISLDLKFNEAYVLKVPFYGSENAYEQLAYAAAGDVTLDEAQSDNLLLESPSDKATDAKQKSNILDFLNGLKDQAGGLIAEASGLMDQLANPNTGMFGRDFLETALTQKGSEEEEQLVEAIQNSDSLRGAINAQLTKNRISEQSGTPTSSDASDDPDSENPSPNDEENPDETATAIPIWSSQLVPGLEGPGDDPRIARVFGSILDDKINAYKSSTTLRQADSIETDTTVNRQSITQPVERGSVRQTAFAHLMSQHSGASSTMLLSMQVRGDPWWWGKSYHYLGDSYQSEYLNDLEGAYFDSGGPHILLMIEAPRKLDFDTSDEDADENTGLFNFGHLNYTMSGVYLVTSVASNLSGGVFTSDLELVRDNRYEISKLERVKQIVEQRIQASFNQIDNEGGGIVAQTTEAMMSDYNDVFRDFSQENPQIAADVTGDKSVPLPDLGD